MCCAELHQQQAVAKILSLPPTLTRQSLTSTTSKWDAPCDAAEEVRAEMQRWVKNGVRGLGDQVFYMPRDLIMALQPSRSDAKQIISSYDVYSAYLLLGLFFPDLSCMQLG